jgi:hypothetical protein
MSSLTTGSEGRHGVCDRVAGVSGLSPHTVSGMPSDHRVQVLRLDGYVVHGKSHYDSRTPTLSRLNVLANQCISSCFWMTLL